MHNIHPDYVAAIDTLFSRLTPDSTFHDANFSASIYDWSIMEDFHDATPRLGDGEVAELSYQAAIACDMFFGIHGSGSNSFDAANGLENHFRYDQDIFALQSSISQITYDLTWLRPVLIGGCGHEWVIYGYDKSTDPDRLFLRNMGWGGSGDGWYTIDDWCPVGDTESVFYISPLGVVRFVGNDFTGDGSPSNPYISLWEALVNVPDGTTLIFEAGSVNTYTGTELVIDRPMILMGEDVTIYPDY